MSDVRINEFGRIVRGRVVQNLKSAESKIQDVVRAGFDRGLNFFVKNVDSLRGRVSELREKVEHAPYGLSEVEAFLGKKGVKEGIADVGLEEAGFWQLMLLDQLMLVESRNLLDTLSGIDLFNFDEAMISDIMSEANENISRLEGLLSSRSEGVGGRDWMEQNLEKRLKGYYSEHIEKLQKIASDEKIKELEEKTGIRIVGKKGLWERFMDFLRGRKKVRNEKIRDATLHLAEVIKRENGGIIGLLELYQRLRKKVSDETFSVSSVEDVINDMRKEGLIPGIRTLDSGVKIVEFAVIDYTRDAQKILEIASEKGWITPEEAVVKTGWSLDRVLSSLKALQDRGISRVDESYSGGQKWYFPGLMSTSKS
ncbi:MAG: hypothetical protein QW279_05285 [Candidatus Jordarchaeaceae archaeon]